MKLEERCSNAIFTDFEQVFAATGRTDTWVCLAATVNGSVFDTLFILAKKCSRSSLVVINFLIDSLERKLDSKCDVLLGKDTSQDVYVFKRR